MIEQYNIISSTAAGGVPTSTAKIKTPDEFAQKIENAIVHKYIKSPNGRGGVMVISKDYIPAGKIIAERDAAIRAEQAELLRVCGEALEETTRQLENMNQSPAHACSWVKPQSGSTTERIRKNKGVLAALREKEVIE